MKKLLKTNIKQSVNLLMKEIPKIDPKFIEVLRKSTKDRFSLVAKLAEKSLTSLPWFYNGNSRINSPQSSFFGFYAFRNIVRGIVLGVNYFKSGNVLCKKNLFSPSISMYYTSAFHFLHSFLALNGRVIIDPVLGPVQVEIDEKVSSLCYKRLDKHPDVIIAILTDDNKWVFEKRKRSHEKRWQELNQIFNERDYEIPKYFKELFKYLNSYGKYNDLEANYKTLLKMISEVRHTALYTSYGYDDYVHDVMLNRDTDSSYGIDLKVRHFRAFAGLFLKDVLSQLIGLIKEVELDESIKLELKVSIITPPFETYNLHDLEDDAIYKMLSFLMDWLYVKNGK